MPTVIDSLIVELDLDPTKYNKARAGIESDFKKDKETLRTGSQDVAKTTDVMSEGFSRLRNHLLGVAALFTAGVGLKAFVQQTVTADAHIGRLSTVVGEATETISSWRGAGTLAGGSAESFTNIIKTLSLEMARLQLTGESQVIPYFRALGISVVDNAGKFKTASQLLFDVADAIDKRKVDPARATLILQSMGADEASISAVLKGRQALQGYFDQAKRAGEVTKEDVAAANELTRAWNELEQSSTALGRSILTWLTPGLVTLLHIPGAISKTVKDAAGDTTGQGLAALSAGGEFAGFFPTPSAGPGSAGDHAAARTSVPLGGTGGALRIKPGAGTRGPGVDTLAQSLQREIPGLNRFTAFNDDYHAGTGSKHAQDLALDFTLRDPSTSAAVAAQIRAKLLGLGVQGTVLDEYANPSPGATGGHIHVQFSDAAAAAKFAGIGGIGGSGAAVAGSTNNSRANSSTSEVSINTLIVQAPQGADADAFAGAIKNSLKTLDMGVQANAGQQ